MRKILFLSFFISNIMFALDIGGLLKQGTSVLNTSNSSSSLQSDGLKKALNVGVDYAIKSLSGDGFLNNQELKIPLPKSLESIAGIANKLGGKKYVDDLVTTINKAAGEAVPKTASIFGNAISNLTFDDAKKILSGGDNAATQYFQQNTSTKLQSAISPIIQQATKENKVISSYETLMNFYNKNNPEGGKIGSIIGKAKGVASVFGADKYLPLSNEDLNTYVTRKAMDGLFNVIGKQEKAIRANPLGYGDLIKQVFSK